MHVSSWCRRQGGQGWSNCRNEGHVTTGCPSKGGGTYTAPTPKGKGGGKGYNSKGKGFNSVDQQGWTQVAPSWLAAEQWPELPAAAAATV